MILFNETASILFPLQPIHSSHSKSSLSLSINTISAGGGTSIVNGLTNALDHLTKIINGVPFHKYSAGWSNKVVVQPSQSLNQKKKQKKKGRKDKKIGGNNDEYEEKKMEKEEMEEEEVYKAEESSGRLAMILLLSDGQDTERSDYLEVQEWVAQFTDRQVPPLII